MVFFCGWHESRLRRPRWKKCRRHLDLMQSSSIIIKTFILLSPETMTKFSSVLVCLLAAKSAVAFAPNSQLSVARSSELYMAEMDSGARDPVKVGVIGCGRIGIVHLGAITKAPGVVPVVVSNPTVSKAEKGELLTCIWCATYSMYQCILQRNLHQDWFIQVAIKWNPLTFECIIFDGSNS